MAGGHRFAVVVVVVVVVVASFLLTAPVAVNTKKVKISTYWGTNPSEGSLEDACRLNITSVGGAWGAAANENNLYDIVNIGFLDKFGYGATPTLNLNGHCDPTLRGCKYIGDEIAKCKARGTKVFISIGGPGGDYTLASEEDAKWVAEYVWDAFLGGKNPYVDRPFGDDAEAVLDGVDLFVEDSTTQYWDVLAEALRNLSNKNIINVNGSNQYMEFSATPRCSHPDKYLGAAIQGGYFDYVQVRFYNDSSCHDNGNFHNMSIAWSEYWTSDENVETVFVGVTASPDDGGHVNATVLIHYFLQPTAVKSPKFGGVMVWCLLTDSQEGYSRTVGEYYF